MCNLTEFQVGAVIMVWTLAPVVGIAVAMYFDLRDMRRKMKAGTRFIA